MITNIVVTIDLSPTGGGVAGGGGPGHRSAAGLTASGGGVAAGDGGGLDGRGSGALVGTIAATGLGRIGRGDGFGSATTGFGFTGVGDAFGGFGGGVLGRCVGGGFGLGGVGDGFGGVVGFGGDVHEPCRINRKSTSRRKPEVGGPVGGSTSNVTVEPGGCPIDTQMPTLAPGDPEPPPEPSSDPPSDPLPDPAHATPAGAASIAPAPTTHPQRRARPHALALMTSILREITAHGM